MVCGRENPLDYAHYRHWNIRLWTYDLLVRTNLNCLSVYQLLTQPPAFPSSYTSLTRSHTLPAPHPLRPCFESTYLLTYSPSTTVFILFSSFLGFVFPLFGTQMYNALGLGPGNSMLAGLAIVIGIPFPIWIWYKGEEIRSRNPLNR